MKELWTCEYSLEQDCFHIDTLENTLASNMSSAMEFRTTSYMLIGVFETEDGAHICANKFRKIMTNAIKENGGEFECANCVYRKIPNYFFKRNTCKLKEEGYSCKECL